MGDTVKETDASKATTIGGGAILGALITGVSALFFAFSSNGAGHFEAAGIGFVAAAVAFVGVASVVFRH
ncbi:MAG: hypothetical protein ACJ74H_00300 [Thermoanaerobaculia bacterium]